MKRVNFLNTTTNDARPVHLFFGSLIDKVAFDEQAIEVIQNQPRRISFCNSWNDLGERLKLKPLSIGICVNELQKTSAVELVNMISTVAKLVGIDYNIPIAVAINKSTPYSLIKELQKSGIHGIIPYHYDFSLAEAEKGCHALWNGIPYWPKQIMDQLPGAKPQKQVDQKDIKLTARQNQILNMVIERGSSNKVIARTLNISESTVKLHLGNIFKKYGVKNRTQLAVFAKK